MGALSAQIVSQVVLTWLLAFAILPHVSSFRQEPQVRLVEKALGHIGEKGTLAAFRYRKTALVFYSKKVVRFLEAHQIAALDSLSAPLAVITREKHLAELLKFDPELEILGHDDNLILLGR